MVMVRIFKDHRHSIVGEKQPSPFHRLEKLTIVPVSTEKYCAEEILLQTFLQCTCGLLGVAISPQSSQISNLTQYGTKPTRNSTFLSSHVHCSVMTNIEKQHEYKTNKHLFKLSYLAVTPSSRSHSVSAQGFA